MSENCSRCNGNGKIPCPGCGGRGAKSQNKGLNETKVVNCSGCNGSGRVTCGGCGGSGKK